MSTSTIGDTEMTAPTATLTAQDAADAEATFQLLAQHRQVNTIISPATVECSCDAVLPLPSGNIDWPNAEHMAMIRHHSEILAAAKLALPDTPDQVTFSGTLRTGSNPAPAGWSDARWHQDASLDSGTSHTLVGPAYVIQCQWCPQVFIGRTKGETLPLFRAHESAAQGGNACP